MPVVAAAVAALRWGVCSNGPDRRTVDSWKRPAGVLEQPLAFPRERRKAGLASSFADTRSSVAAEIPSTTLSCSALAFRTPAVEAGVGSHCRVVQSHRHAPPTPHCCGRHRSIVASARLRGRDIVAWPAIRRSVRAGLQSRCAPSLACVASGARSSFDCVQCDRLPTTSRAASILKSRTPCQLLCGSRLEGDSTGERREPFVSSPLHYVAVEFCTITYLKTRSQLHPLD